MKLNEIKNIASSLPTIMGISNELLIISELMNVKSNELVENRELFRSIVNQVWLSYTDSAFTLLRAY